MINYRLLKPYSRAQNLIYSDASASTAGAYIVKSTNTVFHNVWSNKVKAISLAMKAYCM
jgi:hypothetical protein